MSTNGIDMAGEPSADDLFRLLRARRGWTDEFLSGVDDPSHADLMDLDRMVAELHTIHETATRLVVIPDFDMDGIASGVLGHAGLAELGFNVGLHTPDYRRGHDVGPADMAEIAARWPDTGAVITCDGGINGAAGIADARARGWRVLVTDHHEELPPGSIADVAVDPCRIGETYATRGICGAHVLYQVLERYAELHDPDRLWAIRLLRLFAGLGTISDVMPLVRENRQLVRDSVSVARLLRAPAPLTINPWSGQDPDPDGIDVDGATLLTLLAGEDHDPVFVAALQGFGIVLKAFQQAGKLRGEIDEEFYGWYLAPAFNSPRRIGTPIDDCFDVFAPGSIDDRLAAAHRIIEGNEARKRSVAEAVAGILDSDQPLAPFVYISGAPTGMLGLLANTLMRDAGHPVVVLGTPRASGAMSGSARAPGWFDVIDELAVHDGMSGIGHQQACGVRVSGPAAAAELAGVLADGTARALADSGGAVEPETDLVLGDAPWADAGLDDPEPLEGLCERIEALHPFGHGFEAPLVEAVVDRSGIRVERIGSDAQHLRITTAEGMRLLWWNAADRASDLEEGSDWLRFTGRLGLNEFRGRTNVQLTVDQMLTGEPVPCTA